MRIDFLITELNVGGAEKALTELAIGMHRRSHRVRVFSIGSEPVPARRGLVDRLEGAGVSLHFGGFDRWTKLPSAARWLSHQMCGDPPDVCQTFLFHANCLGAYAAKNAGAKVLVGGLRVAESKRLRLAIERNAVGRMSHLVCVSGQVKTFAIERLSVDPHRCTVIPNGVDLATYRDATPVDWSVIGWPPDSKVALFVGRLHRQKGIELLQQQFEAIFGRDSKRRLLIIGDGPLRKSLTRWSKRSGHDRVQLLPWQSDVAPFLKAATMVILPSHYEGMPNVVMEAMAAGRPVVCSRVQGSEELLGGELLEGGAGDRYKSQGFEPGDGSAMARLVDTLFRDHERCRALGAENQRHIESEFSNPQMVDRYEALYGALLSEQSQARNQSTTSVGHVGAVSPED